MQRGKTHVIVGGAWGSEAKGLACEYFALKRHYAAAVRTGAINAGHTVYFQGLPYAMQQLPVAWINSAIKLIVGAGAYIEPETLAKELDWLDKLQWNTTLPRDRVFIDENAYMHLHEFAEKEQGMHERMGSTAHGVGEAIKDKIGRKDRSHLFTSSEFYKQNNNKRFQTGDTVDILHQMLMAGQDVMVEGTQGTLLDFHYGAYPFVTGRQTIASAWLAEAGLPPKNVEVTMVLRTFPIRVAGNSGPMGNNEVSWVQLVGEMNTKRAKAGMPALVDPSVLQKFEDTEKIVATEWDLPVMPTGMNAAQREQYATQLSLFHREVLTRMTDDEIKELKKVIEITTVTKKVRRIARMNDIYLRTAAHQNAPDNIFLNFLNYEFPTLWGVHSWGEVDLQTKDEIRKYLRHIEDVTGAPVLWVSTGPQTVLEVRDL